MLLTNSFSVVKFVTGFISVFNYFVVIAQDCFVVALDLKQTKVIKVISNNAYYMESTRSNSFNFICDSIKRSLVVIKANLRTRAAVNLACCT